MGTPNPRLQAQEDRAERADRRAEADSYRAEQRFQTQQQREDLRDAHSLATDRRQTANTDFDNISSLRKEFTSRKEVQDFTTILPQVASAMEIAKNPNATGADDLNLIYTFGKVMDPGSVVREGELALASSTGSWAQNLQGAIERLRSGDKLPPAVRHNLVESMRRRGVELSRSYNFSRHDYQARAERFGYNPLDVVGQHPATPFQQAEADFTGKAVGNYDGSVGARPGSSGGGRGTGQSDLRPQMQSYSVDNIADLATGLSGGKYTIEREGLYYTASGGHREMVDLSDDIANSDEYHAAYRAKFGTEPELQVSVSGGTKGPASAPRGRGDGGAVETADAFLRGAADTASLGTVDEISAAGRTIFGGGTMRDNLRSERAVDAYDRENHGLARFAGQFAGGFALPMGRAGTNLPPSAMDLAKIGAGYSGAYGFGSGEGSATDRLISAGTNAIAGGIVGYGLGRGGEALLNLSRRPSVGRSVNMDTVQAADRQGIELVRPDADPTRRNAYGFLESLPIAGGRIRSDLQRGADQIEQRVADVGGGVAVPRATAGDTVRAAGERFIDRSRTLTNRLYDRAATLAGNARVAPRQALNAIDNHIVELSQTPNANRTKLDLLNQFRADLVDQNGNLRPLSIQAIRDLRTAMRDELGTRGLRFTDTERRMMQAIDSASADISSQLRGPALRAYQRADQAYRRRIDLIDNVVERFIGNDRTARRSGEGIMAQVESASLPKSGDAQALSQMMERLEPRERQQVASTIAAQLGRRGQDGDNAFSPNLFFSQVAKYSPEARAAIFGQQGARDLADLARIAEGRAGTLARLNNSRSGQVGNWFKAIQSILSGGGAGAGVGAAMGGVAGAGTGAAAGIVTTPMMLGGAYLSARALGNRRVVQTLLQAANATSPSARAVVLTRIGALANREPALRTELLPIQRLLSSSIEGARPALAADEGDRRRQQR
ncbi:hypothetical protein BRX43_03155 [Sphingomonas sp. S-NIH.Pt15_0812]|nr:hypothetical protein BRX43_03155 [Sphingomonas sp. S-NIH.Pt15_0812]